MLFKTQKVDLYTREYSTIISPIFPHFKQSFVTTSLEMLAKKKEVFGKDQHFIDLNTDLLHFYCSHQKKNNIVSMLSEMLLTTFE